MNPSNQLIQIQNFYLSLLFLYRLSQIDSKFERYNNIKPYPVTVTYRKNGKKHTVKRNLTGKDAFNNHFVDKVQAVSQWLEEKGRTNIRFMNELTTSTK